MSELRKLLVRQLVRAQNRQQEAYADIVSAQERLGRYDRGEPLDTPEEAVKITAIINRGIPEHLR